MVPLVWNISHSIHTCVGLKNEELSISFSIERAKIYWSQYSRLKQKNSPLQHVGLSHHSCCHHHHCYHHRQHYHHHHHRYHLASCAVQCLTIVFPAQWERIHWNSGSVSQNLAAIIIIIVIISSKWGSNILRRISFILSMAYLVEMNWLCFKSMRMNVATMKNSFFFDFFGPSTMGWNLYIVACL